MNNLYDIAKNCLGTRQTLDTSISSEVGCAEAVSSILHQAGVQIPSGGIPGTASLMAWLKTNPHFQVVSQWQAGDIIISSTGSGNGKIPGHTGIMGNYGIMSNDSNTGLFLELWTLPKWQKYYQQYGGMPIDFFRRIS